MDRLFNHRRLFEPIGYVPPAEYEARYYEQARGGLTYTNCSPTIPVRFNRDFANVALSSSYREKGNYNYKALPGRARRYKV